MGGRDEMQSGEEIDMQDKLRSWELLNCTDTVDIIELTRMESMNTTTLWRSRTKIPQPCCTPVILVAYLHQGAMSQ